MKKLFCTLLAALLCAGAMAMPAAAADEEMIVVNDDISVSAYYDWTRLADQDITLNVYNWGLYISDGSDESVDILSAFTELTGIEVNYTTYDTNESLYAKLKSGGADYDVDAAYGEGVTAIFPINRLPQDFSVLKEHSEENLAFAAENVLRTMRMAGM